MLHLRLVVPAELAEAVVELLLGYPGVAHVTVVAGAARDPVGDLIEADVVREAVDELLDALDEVGLPGAGAITADHLELSISAAADRAAAAAPGSSSDSVVWAEVIRRTREESAVTGTFLAFLTIATVLAAIGIVLDSPITIVGAMVVGPEFGPLAAISVGLVRRRSALVRRGLLALGIGFPLAVLVTAVGALLARQVGLIAPDALSVNPQTEFIYEPGWFSFIVALLAGAAGMLSMTSQKAAALVGVFISVTTVPAAGYVALGAVLGDWNHVRGSALQLVLNLVAILVSGLLTLAVVRRFDVFRAGRRRRVRRSA